MRADNFASLVIVLLIIFYVLRVNGIRRSIDGDSERSREFGSRSGNEQRRAVTEEEISYIGSTLQPRECLSLLYLLHHGYKRRRKREIQVQTPLSGKLGSIKRSRSAQITPCETMLLNYWRDPNSMRQRDCFKVSRTLREVKREDLARWLCTRRPSCFDKTIPLNVTNDVSSLSAQMQIVPIYSVSRRPTDHRHSSPVTTDNSYGINLQDTMMWIYIALAICATAAVLFCMHYFLKRLRKSSQYIALADKDIRNVQFSCGCIEHHKTLSLPCNKKNMRFHLHGSGCGCSGNQ